MEFRNNEVNYLTILMRLDYFFYMLEEHTSKFNKFWIMLTVGVFSKFFPNITSLLYERYSLIKLIPAIEEGELSDDDLKVVTDEDLCLYDFAERLSKFGLRLHDDSKFFIN